VRCWSLLLLVVPVWVTAAPARASMSLNQLYETYSYSSFPEISVLERPEIRQQRFPDHLTGALSVVEYGEIDYYSYGLLDVITCTTDRDGYATTVYYGTDGYSRIMHQGLALRARQQVTLSGRLPAATRGVTLLLLWNEPPDTDALARLAAVPNDLDLTIAGVREARWLPQRDASIHLEPWRDPFRPDESVDKDAAAAGWPWSSARLFGGLRTVCKDCAVEFTGLTSLGFDDYGSFGQWRLDWGSELVLYCELPVAEGWDGVDLLLIGSVPQFGEPVDLSLLELEINGWPVRLRRSLVTSSSNMQHVTLSLSQYLHGGGNRIKMRLSSLASSEWLIHGIEVWVY